MKKVFILIVVVSLSLVVINAKAFSGQYDEIEKSSKVDITIINDIYTDFKIDFQGSVFLRPYWVNTANPTWSP